jgi:copper chaperone CopZ
MPARSRIPTAALMLIAPVCVATGCGKSEDRPPPAAKVIVSGPTSQPATDDPLVAEPGTRLVALAVEGMHCSGCVEAITAKLQKLDGVRKVRVSLARRTAWVMLDDAHPPKISGIVDAIESLGYKAKPEDAPTSRPSLGAKAPKAPKAPKA